MATLLFKNYLLAILDECISSQSRQTHHGLKPEFQQSMVDKRD